MKKLMFALCLLLTLSACGQTTPTPENPAPSVPQEEVSVPEPPAQPVEPQAEVPAPPAEENPTDTPADETQPEVPEEPSVPDLPPLPQPVYTYGSTAVDDHGQILLEEPGFDLRVIFDAHTKQARAIAAIEPTRSTIQRLYDLSGSVLLDNLNASQCAIMGDLFWCESQGMFRLMRLSDGTTLQKNVDQIEVIGNQLAVQPAYWLSGCSILDETGATVTKLPTEFYLKAVYQNPKKTYLVMGDHDGQQTVMDLEGTTYLGRSYDEVADIVGQHALVRNGSQWLAVDLATGKVLYQNSSPFTLLPEGALVAAGANGRQKLVNFQGQPLYDSELMEPQLLDLNEDGLPDWIAAVQVKNLAYTSVILDTNGQELLSLPDEAAFLTPISPELVFAVSFTGKSSMSQEGTLYDLKTGSTSLLIGGVSISAAPVKVGDQTLIFCRSLNETNRTPMTRLFTTEAQEMLKDVVLTDYQGGDVFTTTNGLICLDGTWLYKA